MVLRRLALIPAAALSALAASVAQTPPAEVLGFEPGADFKLATYEQAMRYFDVLEAETDRMVMFDMGPTSEGRRMRYAVISSPENLARLDELKELNRRLTLARGVSREEAERLAEEGVAIVWIDGGLHATEVAPAQHNIQLAYDMVTGEDRRTRLIREQVILVLVFANPDGMSLVSQWYMNNVGTEYETSTVPELYNKYAGHDNNRDSMLSNLAETRNMNRATSQEWFPEILYNHHQSAPFPARIFIPPEAEATNPNVHPLVLRWKNLIGSAMGKAFDEADQPGAISRINYDNWWPGYVTQIVESHNVPAILTETALYRYATPHFYTVNDFPAAHRDMVIGTFYPSPWRGGWWRLKDAVDYCLTASVAVLETAAKYRFELLFNKWKMATDVMERFQNEPPYGWIFSRDQRDPSTTALLLERMMVLGAEVYLAETPFVHAGIRFPEGSYVVPTSQPFGLFVKNLLEIQEYPDLREHPHLWQGLVGTFNSEDLPPLRPYDGVGWTLPAQMGVDALRMERPLDEDARLTPATRVLRPIGGLSGSGAHYVFTHTDNNSFAAVNRILAAGGAVGWALSGFAVGDQDFPAGSFVVEAASIDADRLREIAGDSGIPMTGGRVSVQVRELSAPRIGVYKSWVANMDAGWIRYVLEQYGFEYDVLTDAEMRAGALRDRYDVIILSDQGAGSIVNGHRKGSIHPDYVGGITAAGVDNLKGFVRSGGTLISNKNSNDLLIDAFELPLRNVLDGVSRNEFNVPGAILRMGYRTDHPLAFGMPEDGTAYFAGGARGYEIVTADELAAEAGAAEAAGEDGQRGTGRRGGGQRGGRGSRGGKPRRFDTELPVAVAASYPEEPLLVTGWQIGEELLQGTAAVVDVPIEQGNVVLFGFNVHNRAQSYLTFKLLFNALYNR